jgi:hypothetical protein
VKVPRKGRRKREKEKEEEKKEGGNPAIGDFWGKSLIFLMIFVIPIEIGAWKTCRLLEIFLVSNSRLRMGMGLGFEWLLLVLGLFVWTSCP